MILRILLLLILIIGLGFLIYHKSRIKYGYGILIFVLVMCYAFIVFWFTFYDRDLLSEPSSMLIPLESYYSMAIVGWHGWGVYIFYGLVGNTLIFVPIGMMIAQFPGINHKHLWAGVVGFIVSLSIEITQYYTALGTFEVDDLIHNTWGAVIGCAIALALMKKEKSIKANIKILAPLIVFVVLIGTASVLSIGRDLFSRL